MSAKTPLRRSPSLKIKYVIIACFLFVLPLRSMAWGMLGHRIVGEIADSYINKKTRSAIREILGNESIAMASNWADFIKSDPAFNYLSSWHYIDFDGEPSYDTLNAFLKQDTAVDAYTKLNFLVSELKKRDLEKDKQVMYLRLVIHIVGDLHQPMHTGHTADKGGNGVKVMWFGQPSNLHSIWDSGLIEQQQLSYTEYTKAINFTTPSQRTSWMNEDLSKWIFDSHVVAEDIYRKTAAGSNLSYRYNFDFLEVANTQLLKGGVHLAGLLNQIFS